MPANSVRMIGIPVLLICLLLASVGYLAHAAGSSKQYHIYGVDKSGSKFKQQIYTSPIPLNRSYDKLSDEHKTLVLSEYSQLGKGDTPPFPCKGIGKILKPYVKQFRWHSNLDGGLYYAAVDQQGKVTAVRAIGVPYSDVVSFVSKLLYKVPFDPALCAGEPCVGEFVLRLEKIDDPACISCL